MVTQLDEILAELEGDWYGNPVPATKRKIIKLLLTLTERIAWQDPADGSWLIEPKQLRQEIRKL